MKKSKRILSIVLALVIMMSAVSGLQLTAHAADEPAETVAETQVETVAPTVVTTEGETVLETQAETTEETQTQEPTVDNTKVG